MLEIVLATTNPGKIREFTEMLKHLPIRLIPQTELNIPDVEETGSTFVENAIIKARHAAVFSGLPVIADDSGLMVDSLDGAPGVRSARYAGNNMDDSARIQKLLLELEQAENPDRAASFYCVTVFMDDAKDPAPLLFEGEWSGTILTEPMGTRGFGYDPIFYVPTHHCTAAELDSTVKNSISHRGQALSQLLGVLEQVVV